LKSVATEADGHDAGSGDGLDPLLRDALEVIGGDGADLCGEVRSAAVGELVGMQLPEEAGVDPRFQDSAGFLPGEGGLLQKDVAAAREALPGGMRDDLLHDQVHVASPVLAILGGDDVRGEKCRHDANGSRLGEATVDRELLQLFLQREAISALAFDGRDAEGQHLVQEEAGALVEILLARRPGRPDGGEDPAAGLGDLQVGAAEDPLLELAGAPAGEGEVGVAVDEAGNDEPASGVQALVRPVLEREVGLGPEPADLAVLPGERGLADGVDLRLAAVGAAGGEVAYVAQDRHRIVIRCVKTGDPR
jgi:hypothetical protein